MSATVAPWNLEPISVTIAEATRLLGFKDVLRNHRGLPEEHMRRACEWVCYMKTAHPRPESFIPDALRKGEKATTPEPDDSVAPAYGTGIDWNEFHTTTRYPNTTD